MIFFPQICNLSLFTGKTTDVPWLLTTRKIPLKIVKVMHNKFALGYCHRAEEAGETRQPSTAGTLDCIPEQKEDIMEKWWDPQKVQILVKSSVPECQCLSTERCAMVRGDDDNGETG